MKGEKKEFIWNKKLKDISLRDIIDFSALTLAIWILYQLISLYSIWMLGFFSRTQVINDTAILTIPILLLCIGIKYGYKLQKDLKRSEEEKKIKSWNKIIITILFVIIPIWLKILFTRMNRLDIWNLYVYYVFWFFLPWIGYGILYKFIIDDIVESWFKDILNIVYMIFLIGTSIVAEINWSLYKSIYLREALNQDQKVEYMNDKYVFIKYETWVNVINRTDDMNFLKKIEVKEKNTETDIYSWVIVDLEKYDFLRYDLWFGLYKIPNIKK